MTDYMNKKIRLDKKAISKMTKAFSRAYKGILNAKTYKVYNELFSMLLENRLSIQSKSRYIQLKAVVNKAKAIGLLLEYSVLPFSKRSGNQTEKIMANKYITADELANLQACLPNTNKATQLRLAMDIAYFSGLRLEETLSLKPENIDFTDGVKITIQSGKGNKYRTTYLPKRFSVVLDGFKGFTINKNYVQRTFKIAVEKYNKANPNNPIETTFHGLRHSFCTNLAKGKVAIEDIRDMAGHSSIAVTDVYIHATREKSNEFLAMGY